jgi:hypothetical protein
MVATADRNAQEGKSDLDRGRTGFGEGDRTGLDYLGGPGMVVLFLSPGVRVEIHDQCWELYGHVPRRHDITNKRAIDKAISSIKHRKYEGKVHVAR